MKKYDIFISYRRKSASGLSDGTYVARMLKMELQQRGYTVFFDYNECTDGDFVDRILPAIKNSKYFILVITSGALTRCADEYDWVRREIREALKADCKIVPVSPDQGFNGWPENFPEELNTLKTIQVSDINTGTLFEKSTDLIVEKRLAPPKHFNFKKLINISVIAVLAVLTFFLAYNNNYQHKEKLLFLGSGTVDAYLNRYGVNSWDYPNGIYTPLPTASALKVLSEERTVGPYTTKGKHRSYFPVVFSAINANETDLMATTSDMEAFMKDIGRIGRVFLTNDSLQLMLYPKDAFQLDNDSIITGKQLAKLLHTESHKTKIFRTSKGSGTYRAYTNLLKNSGINLDTINATQFVRKTTTLNDFGNHFIVLGSSTYQGAVDEPGFDETMRNNTLFLSVRDEDGLSIYKPLYIYIVAYIVDGMKNEVVIPDPVMKFLEKIDHKPSNNVHGATAELFFDI